VTIVPEISVVIPAYNAEAYVGDAIRSVLSQTLADIELIVIDDGSTDNTLSEIERASGADSRVRIMSRENRGIVKTPNEGISLARSPWVAMLDADDISRPTRLERQLCYAKQFSLHVVGCQLEYKGSANGFSRFPERHADIVHQLFVWKNPIANPSVMFDQERLGEIRYPETRIHAQDYALWLDLAAQGGARFGVLQEPLVCYRVHSAQNTKQNTSRLYDACVDAMREAIRSLGLADPVCLSLHEAAFRKSGRFSQEEFTVYSEWLVDLRKSLIDQAGYSCEIFKFWHRLYRGGARNLPYQLSVGKALGGSWLDNAKLRLKYRG
jgi:glycosyltransferase involved in cell wall biosynthesis